MTMPTRESVAQLDANDPLAPFRDQFVLPDGVLYLDGNSLGALPKATQQRIATVIAQEWGTGLVRSWNAAGWIDMPRQLGDKIGRLIGAKAGEVIVADSTSVNLFKVLAAALKLRPKRRIILSEPDNFPTDLYMAQGLADLLGSRHELVLLPSREIAAAIDAQVAVVLLTQVNYRTGAMHDMAALTALAHEHGALTIWDLSHSAGALPVDLTGAKADFALGCGYKYLNGGPGAPAYVYVAKRLQAKFSQPLSGWMGHSRPFDFDWHYEPARGIARYLCGTQPVLSMAALECGLDLLLAADMSLIRAKSLKMVELFIQLVAQQCDDPLLELATPFVPERHGSQVSFRHPQGYAIMQALIARGVIGDFRAPDIIRFGFTPLYTRYQDLWDAVGVLAEVLAKRSWDTPKFKRRAKVT